MSACAPAFTEFSGMQKLMSGMRSCMEAYNMIEPGDKIAVAVSGGKDSVTLLAALAEMRRFYPAPYSLYAVTIDMCFGGKSGDYSEIAELCRMLDVPYTVRKTEIARIIFDVRKEKNPCSLCARMRRGALHDTAVSLGCNKVALGHHADDAAETFFLNLFLTGQLGSFPPVHYMSRKNIYLIRPMILTYERDISGVAKRYNLPVKKSGCPADGNTMREQIKRQIAELEKTYPGLKSKVLGALRRAGYGGW